MAEDTIINDDVLEQARNLVTQIESGEEAKVKATMDELSRYREADLFKEMGKLTRELHDSLNSFKLDSRIAELTEEDIPDAKERLNYVISMTEQAANKTLNAVEESIPLSEEMQKTSDELFDKWKKFRGRELSADEFRELSGELDKFFPMISESSQSLQKKLTEVLMAQDFQDLTGQIIRRVINLVHDVEEGLVDLIRMSGKGKTEKTDKTQEEIKAEKIKGEGPAVPNTGDEATISGQDDVDDLLSSLGF
jgi:chemotaxis protein CheZ